VVHLKASNAGFFNFRGLEAIFVDMSKYIKESLENSHMCIRILEIPIAVFNLRYLTRAISLYVFRGT
jgi:hypothetical protein